MPVRVKLPVKVNSPVLAAISLLATPPLAWGIGRLNNRKHSAPLFSPAMGFCIAARRPTPRDEKSHFSDGLPVFKDCLDPRPTIHSTLPEVKHPIRPPRTRVVADQVHDPPGQVALLARDIKPLPPLASAPQIG